jgi:hypothetical protein
LLIREAVFPSNCASQTIGSGIGTFHYQGQRQSTWWKETNENTVTGEGILGDFTLGLGAWSYGFLGGVGEVF